MSRLKLRRPSPALVIALVALFAAMGGSAVAATKLFVHTRNIANGAVTSSKLANGAVGTNKLNRQVRRALAKAGSTRGIVSGPRGGQGPKGDKGDGGPKGDKGDRGDGGAMGPQGPRGATGPAGPAGPAGPSELAGSRACTPDLCIDAGPGPGGSAGSGGWGWDNAANMPVTSVAVGSTNGLTVTVLQPNGETADGSITLTYDPYDFSYVGNGDSSAKCSSTSDYPSESCTYTDLAHSTKGDAFQFTANHADPNAVVTATVVVGGEQASAQFPVAITG